MGLDITAYRNIKKLDVLYDVDGEPVTPDTGEPIERPGYTRFYVNPDFPGRADDVEHKGCYSFDDEYGFRAGSYGGYNTWREQLAALVEYPTVRYERVPGYAPSAEHRHDAAAWAGLCDGRPFVELINFSDCEGVIGSAVSAKLARDFADWDDRAKSTGDKWFYSLYQHWRMAFEMAADKGAVSFH